ncbi:39S ribosomal protein L21, mitochondrial-like [Pollicipes pollicipes]|uniref:39S ribosomal protein L21, mitochondrial-like n=1 Tax=Pollicipes pollicipes TaxID=41117 RepID=UPI001884DD7E|nr:39S ribosomal protein L21, mitochondrial-like [Pollicipes pollicipes]XP_037071480.1 39S ribosomal protein L21, mitochondrial-like [Pollicipes pollicipes]
MAMARRFTSSLLSQLCSTSCANRVMHSDAASGMRLPSSNVWMRRSGSDLRSCVASLKTSASYSGIIIDQEVQPDDNSKLAAENEIVSGVVSRVNESISEGTAGRLFAVVHVAGKQFKVTDGDLVVVQGHWPPVTGQQLRLQKVLMVGSADFTLLGRPVLEPGMASVEATVVEKSLSHTKTIFRKEKRQNYKRINFCRVPLTTLRINSVRLEKPIDCQT